MNILFVYYIPSGGVETLNRQRCSALKKMNINCHFLYYHKVRDLVNNHAAPTFITNDDDEIKKIVNEGNYSAIIITSDYKSLLRFRSIGYQGKLIFEIQGLGPKHIARLVLMNAIPYVNAYGNGLLSSKTPHIMELLDEIYPSFPKFIFHNCFDTNGFSYKSSQGNKHPIIAWIGRIEENKNWKEFLYIGYQLINNHNSNVQLYMFEDSTLSTPHEREEFNQLIKHLKLEDNLTVYSNIPHDQMAGYFSRIGDSGGFLCSTSKVEGFGYAIVEAMVCHCPVLTTDSDGVRSSIIHNQTGKYYEIGNIPDAVNQALDLMTNNRARDNLRKAALNHVKINYSSAQYGQNFANMIKALE
ncbi:TPA: glycosyltransferase family 4 protein [Bacillus cereus]|nr:glycosyltransferase [Bacillus cereus]MDA1769744.1 glycosyltransferase [Bacillus cereus]